jgi:hypothetical protein
LADDKRFAGAKRDPGEGTWRDLSGGAGRDPSLELREILCLGQERSFAKIRKDPSRGWDNPWRRSGKILRGVGINPSQRSRKLLRGDRDKFFTGPGGILSRGLQQWVIIILKQKQKCWLNYHPTRSKEEEIFPHLCH